jgi:hypothetical protein
MEKTMGKVLSILSIIFGLLIIIGLSIWVGFPAPQGFDRTAICFVGYLLGFVLIVAGFMGLISIYDLL